MHRKPCDALAPGAWAVESERQREREGWCVWGRERVRERERESENGRESS